MEQLPGDLSAGAAAAAAKRARAGPTGLSLLRRVRDMARLGTRALLFAVWVLGHRSPAPQLVVYCDRPHPLSRDQALHLAWTHLLCGQDKQLVDVSDLGAYEQLRQQQEEPAQAASGPAPALPEDVRRSFKERLQRLLVDAEQCSDGLFVAYVVAAGHKTAAKHLVGGAPARSMFCDPAWAAVFEEPLYIPHTAWPPGATRVELTPGTAVWYAAFFDFGWGYILHPTAVDWLLPDALMEVAEDGSVTWRITDTPVNVQVVASAADLGAQRVTCSCRNFRDLTSVVRACVHTVYATCIQPPPPPGPPPPVHVRAARGRRTSMASVLRGDYFWLPDRTFVACAARTGRLRCCHSGCGSTCRHVAEVRQVFQPHLPPPAARSGQQLADAAAYSSEQEEQQQAEGEAAEEAVPGEAAAAEEEEGEEEDGPHEQQAMPRYPYPCNAATAATMLRLDVYAATSALSVASLVAGGGGSGGSSTSNSSSSGSGSGDGLELELVPSLPDGSTCSCGRPYKRYQTGAAVVYCTDNFGPRRARLFELRSGCGCPGCVRVYNGAQDGLFRFSSRSFFSLRLLYGYAEHLISSGMNVKAFVRAQHHMAATLLLPHVQRPPQFGESLFRQAWQRFLSRMDSCHAFICPICGPAPAKVVCDATAATFQSEYYCGTPVTEQTACPGSDSSRVPGGGGGVGTCPPRREHTRAERCWCATEDGRAALRGYSSGLLGNGVDVYGQRAAAAAPDVTAVSARLPEGCRAATVGFLEVACSAARAVGGALGSDARRSLARLVDCLGSTAPAIAYLPLRCAPIVRYWAVVQEQEQQQQQPSQPGQASPASDAIGLRSLAITVAANSAPVLAAALDVVAVYAAGAPPGVLRPVAGFLTRLCDLAGLCELGYDGGEAQVKSAASAETDECLRSGHCCGLGRVRPRYTTAMDAPARAAAESQGAGASSCTHNFCARGPRTGGIFTVFCEHGVCYAFFVLPGAEGRNEMYSWMVSYLERAPKVVVYDFACSLHEYCLNRAPAFFCNTLFVVDRFHWKNHTGCSHAYNMSLYEELEGLNSAVAEQRNSQLQPFKPMVSQMKQASFMSCLRFVLGEVNRRRSVKLIAQLEQARALGAGQQAAGGSG